MNYETTLETQDGTRYPLESADAELSTVPGEDGTPKRRRWAIIALIAAMVLAVVQLAEGSSRTRVNRPLSMYLAGRSVSMTAPALTTPVTYVLESICTVLPSKSNIFLTNYPHIF